jgi:hypothetical protein
VLLFLNQPQVISTSIGRGGIGQPVWANIRVIKASFDAQPIEGYMFMQSIQLFRELVKKITAALIGMGGCIKAQYKERAVELLRAVDFT